MKEITRNLLICVLAVCFGTQFQFFNVTVGSNIAGVLKKWFNESYSEHYHGELNEGGLSWTYAILTACLQIGAVVGSLGTKILAERLGRRKTLMLTGFLEALGASLVGFSKLATSLELFGFGRFVIGLGFGAGLGVASMLISELAPVKKRGAIGTVQQIFIGLGMTAGFAITLPQLVGTDQLWPIAVAAPGIPALIQVIVLSRVHDSPKYLLLAKKNRDASLSSLLFYKGPRKAEGAIAALEAERDQVNNSKKITFSQVLTRPIYKKPLLISFTLMFSIQFTGIAPIMSFSKTIFADAGLDEESAEFASVGLGVMNLVSPFIVLVLVDKFGRRILLLSGLALAFFSLLTMTIFIQLSDQLHSHVLLIVSIPFVYIFQTGYAVTSSVAWVIPSELFPQNVRSYGVALCAFSFFFSQLITVLGYLPFKDAVGVPISMSPFLVTTALCFVFFLIYVPETKGVSPEKFILEQSSRSTNRIRPITETVAVNGDCDQVNELDASKLGDNEEQEVRVIFT